MIPMIRKALILFTTASVAFSAAAVAGEIYKWTDENGNVHYEDRPTGDDVVRVAVSSSNTDNSSVRASIEARRARQEARNDSIQKREEEEQKAAELEQITAEREKKCAESRSRMENYLQARRLYREDENGDRVYLDDSQVMEARSKAQEDIQAYCT
jgi:catalase